MACVKFTADGPYYHATTTSSGLQNNNSSLLLFFIAEGLTIGNDQPTVDYTGLIKEPDTQVVDLLVTLSQKPSDVPYQRILWRSL